MRVLHCIWRMGMGGAERQIIQLSAALGRRNIDVDVATVFAGMNDAHLAATGAVCHRLHAAGKYDPLLIPRMVHLMRRIRPDVVSTWLTQMDILGGLSAEMTSTPWVLCERSVQAAYPRSILHTTRAHVGARADAIVANSDGGGEYWRHFADPARIHVIPNIVPLDEIEQESEGVEEGNSDGDVILYVGRFSEEKNLDRLMDALATVLPQRNATAVFCGEGPLRAAIQRKVAALGIADRTRFLGTVSNVWAWMKRAAVMVAVSVFEGNPNAVLEAIACGTPLVVSDIASHRALVSEESAWLVDPQSADSIANGLQAALGDSAQARARAERARAVIAARSADEIAAQYVDVYESIRRRRA
jgi:glycosyltransferase involved in cell wall biosynthesis